MTEILIRDSRESDFQRIVEINDAEVQHTSPMDINRLGDLDHLSSYHRIAEVEVGVAAFLFAMRDGSPYQNDNYEWFSSRYPSFLYVDRIVVDAKYSGLKIGTKLYQDLFDFARTNNIHTITCEYNLVPSNEPSRLFHERFGFNQVGVQWLANATKKVSLQAAEI